MFIDINTIGPEGLAFERSLRLEGLEGPSREAIPALGAKLAGNVTPSGSGAELNAHLDATVPLTCSRCLETFPWVVSTDFDLSVVRKEPEASEPRHDGDDDVEALVAPEGKIGLEDVAREQVYLSLPLKPVCTPGCKGLCPTCGANRNHGTCGCPPQDVDPRLAPLLQFRRKAEDS